MSAMTRDYGDSAALCLRPSASDPPRGSRFVEIKDANAIRPNGDRPVETLFSFSAVQFGTQFQPDFFVFTVRSAEGRNATEPRGAQMHEFWLNAER
jgi:hypothetical protein